MSNRLNQLLTASGHAPLDPETSARFTAYLALLQKWNARTNLTAIRDEESILSRHFLESILCRVPQVSLLRPGMPTHHLRAQHEPGGSTNPEGAGAFMSLKSCAPFIAVLLLSISTCFTGCYQDILYKPGSGGRF